MATTSALATLPGAICTLHDHHARLSDITRLTGYEITGDEEVITTVRNHWDAVASWWLLDQRRTSLWNFIDNYNHFLFAKRHKLWWLHPEATVVLKYESLQDGLDQILNELGLNPVKIPIENVTPNKTHYLDYYSKCTYQKVLEHFYDEIIFYGYYDATEKDTRKTGTGGKDPGRACELPQS